MWKYSEVSLPMQTGAVPSNLVVFCWRASGLYNGAYGIERKLIQHRFYLFSRKISDISASA